MSKKHINVVFTFDLTCLAFFWSWRWCTFPLTWLLLSPDRTLNTMIHLLWWFWTQSLDQFSVDLSFHGTHSNDWLSDPPRASEERILQQLISCEVLLLKFVDMSSTKFQSMLPTRRLFDDDQTLSHCKFFECFRWFCLLKDAQIAVSLQVTCHHVWTEKTIHKPLPGSKLLL